MEPLSLSLSLALLLPFPTDRYPGREPAHNRIPAVVKRPIRPINRPRFIHAHRYIPGHGGNKYYEPGLTRVRAYTIDSVMMMREVRGQAEEWNNESYVLGWIIGAGDSCPGELRD